MNIRIPRRIPSAFLLSISAGLAAVTQPSLSAELSVAVGSTSEHTDNARKRRGQDSSSEWQTFSNINFAAAHSGSQLDFDLDYRLEDREFWKNSQADDQQINGATDLNWTINSTFGFNASHRRRQLIADSAAADLLANEDSRETLILRPYGQIQLRSNTSLSISPYVSWTEYESDRDLGNSDSERIGSLLNLENQLSRITRFGTQIEVYEADFDENDLTYTGQRANLFYAVDLRNTQYQIEAGLDYIDPESGPSEQSTAYRLEASHSSGFSDIQFSASQSLSDNVSGSPSNSDANAPRSRREGGGEISLVRYQAYFLSIETQSICSRCQLIGSVRLSKEDHLNAPANSIDETLYSLAGSYLFSEQITGRLSLTQRNTDPEDDAQFDENRVIADIRWQVVPRLTLLLGGGYEERDSENRNQSYQEYVGSLGFSYDLY